MNINEFKETEWAVMEFTQSKHGYIRKTNMIWFTKTSPKVSIPSIMNISKNLTDQVRWENGTRVNIFKSRGGNMFMLKPDKAGILTCRDKSGNNNHLSITNQGLALQFRFKTYGTEFDAWVDGDSIIFKPKSNGGKDE